MSAITNRKKLIIFGKNGCLCPGVVNAKTGKSSPPNTLDQQNYFSDVQAVCENLRAEGNTLAVISNEGGVAWNILTLDDADLLTKAAADYIGAAGYRICPFHPKGKITAYARESEDRLPNPGMIESLMHEFGFLAQDTLLVGDWLFEKEAAEAAGCTFEWAYIFFERTADPFADRLRAAMDVK